MLAARAGEERDHADVLAKFQISRGYNVNVSGLVLAFFETNGTLNSDQWTQVRQQQYPKRQFN